MNDSFRSSYEEIEKIYKTNLQAATIRSQNINHVHHLTEEMQDWIRQTKDEMQRVVNEKIDQIDSFHENFQREVEETYMRFKQNRMNSDDAEQDLENFNIYCQSNRFIQRIQLTIDPFTREELESRIRVEYKPFSPRSDVVPLRRSRKTPIVSEKPQEEEEDKSSFHRIDSDPIEPHLEEEILKTGETLIEEPKIRTSTVNSLHPEKFKQEIQVPVLVDKDRDVCNENQRITECSIDSIVFSENQSADRDIPDARSSVKTLIDEYKDLLRDQLKVASNKETYDVPNLRQGFHLQHFDHYKYSLIQFKNFTSKHNCLASSSTRNELLLFNSQLKVIFILQHDENNQCRQRSYFEWFNHFGEEILDICQCDDQEKEYYLLATSKNIFLFDPQTSSVTELNQRERFVECFRIYHKRDSIFCIEGRDDLVEYQLNTANATRKQIRKFRFESKDSKSSMVLIDVIKEDQYLFILYTARNDEIRFQVIDADSKRQIDDVLIDHDQPIDRNSIRIRQTKERGNFLYVNGHMKKLKSIVFTDDRELKRTSEIEKTSKPTNACFLNDGRLVILHEEPKSFLSVHKPLK